MTNPLPVAISTRSTSMARLTPASSMSACRLPTSRMYTVASAGDLARSPWARPGKMSVAATNVQAMVMPPRRWFIVASQVRERCRAQRTTKWSAAMVVALFSAGRPAIAQVGAAASATQTPAAQPTPPRPVPPTRDPHTPGYVQAKELPDAAVPAADADGNFIIGPTHNPAPEMTVQDGVPQGTVYNLTMSSADSKIYPGIARDT